jgi:hypothetical protein
MEKYRRLLTETNADMAETLRDIIRKREEDVDLSDASQRYGYSSVVLPSTAFNPHGGASDPDFDTTNGGFLFDAASTELVFFSFKFPDGYVEGENFNIHVFWQKTTSASGNVLWQLDYKQIKLGEVMPSSFTTLQVSTVNSLVTDDNTADRNLVSSFAAIDGDDYHVTDGMMMKLSRIGGDVLDTYGADVRLLGIVISCPVDTYKTTSQFVK